MKNPAQEPVQKVHDIGRWRIAGWLFFFVILLGWPLFVLRNFGLEQALPPILLGNGLCSLWLIFGIRGHWVARIVLGFCFFFFIGFLEIALAFTGCLAVMYGLSHMKN